MDFILNKRLGSESGYDDLKSCQREARISGISSFIIGFGACCGYAKSIVVMQSYQNRLYQYEGKPKELPTTNLINGQKSLSKYGDEGFYK
ncbi:uncharacterized protein LOC124439071 isoform X3 [Xenia sp. Carnegie-2017]|uniref:uncharacterized protein LOC124439071 isoform X3 n=1 Tax=Xenia sp. Carnegie-2017 TaxID=2897299 RepID=UPI001F048A0E|nr:uncharacterized protein LOC124439071 isoform X3 [Xenia sp. Carnegie-2017]